MKHSIIDLHEKIKRKDYDCIYNLVYNNFINQNTALQKIS
jgi:hypothetical protein